MHASHSTSIGQRLHRERERLNWSQERLAESLGTTARSIHRWEQDKAIPHPHYREQLCQLFKLSTEELFGTPLSEVSIVESCSLRHLPFRRNPFFTGRQDTLHHLYEVLQQGRNIALSQAISGLGGVGKTQIALEYAYRYREDYQAILWVRAETREILLADLIALAEPLNLPERSEHDQQRVLAAVKRWLANHDDWLLILDNVENVALVADLLPSESKGHTILTTRSQATGVVAQHIDVAPMSPHEGSLLLLHRAKLIASNSVLADVSEQTRDEAEHISRVLGGLPLALDQAGAYIEETGCSLSDYLDRYHSHPAALLNRRGNAASEHPSSVLATFSLSFHLIEQLHPAAADLLRLSAFLQPDTIPEELFLSAMLAPALEFPSVVGDAVQFDEALATLRCYSLLKRDPASKTLTIHRLVQAAMQARLSLDMHRIWAERALMLVNAHFPDITHRSNKQIAPTLLAQAYWCADLIQHWYLSTVEAAQLLLKLVAFLQWTGELSRAQQALEQTEALYVRRGLMTFAEALPLLNLQSSQANEQGKYQEAEKDARSALLWGHRLFEHSHAWVATSYENLGIALYSRGKYAEAEVVAQQALDLERKLWGEADAHTVSMLNILSNIFYKQERYEQSVQFLQQALAIAKNSLKFDPLELALLYESLGNAYRDMQRYPEAAAFLQEALQLREKLDLPNHPYQAMTLNSLSGCYFRQGNYVEAELLLRRALTIQRHSLRPEHEAIATTLNNLAKNLAAQQKDEEAEELYQQALALFEQALGAEHLHVSVVLLNLAMLAEKRGLPAKAAPFYQRALKIQESVLGSGHPSVMQIARNYKNIQSLS